MLTLNLVNSRVIDVSKGFGKGRVLSRTKSYQEILIEDLGNGSAIPASAIEKIQ